MDRQIIDYLPEVIKRVPEFEQLMRAEQPELEWLWLTYEFVLENQFLQTSTAYGIGRWENILGIKPKATDDIELRRARVVAMLRIKLPYTIRWLRNWLNALCGDGNFLLATKDYTIEIELGMDNLPDAEKLWLDILNMLLVVRPANMVIDLSKTRHVHGAMTVRGISATEGDIEVWPYIADMEQSGGFRVIAYTESAMDIWVLPRI